MSREAGNPVDQLVCDFTSGAVAHRHRFGGGRGQTLPRAVGMKGGVTPQIVDATAGLGRDAFLLASLGAEVTMIERSAEMHLLLSNAMEKAINIGGDVAEIIRRMTLMHGDARDLIPTLSAEVILIDPMHPPRKGSALVKKEMRLIRDIVGTDPDADNLVRIALAHATKRVVLKWPRKAAPLESLPKCTHQIIGKTTRYDVWMIA